MLETEMIERGTKYFKSQSQISLVRQEVPFLSRCIDIVLLDQEENLISIEFKISKWRHAIEQAKSHMLGADKAYICLPERRVTASLVNAIQEAGLGLLFFSTNGEEAIYEVVPAPNDKKNIPAFRDMLLVNVSRIAL